MIEQDSRDPLLILVCTTHACPVHMHLHEHTRVCVLKVGKGTDRYMTVNGSFQWVRLGEFSILV